MMSMKTIINWLYATIIDRAMTDRRPREDRAMNHSVYRPVSVSYLSRTALVALFLLVLGGLNSEVWGQSYHDNKWWSLYDSESDYSVSSTYFYEKNVFAPTAGSISFEYRKYSDLSTTGAIQLWENSSSYNATSISVSNIKNYKTGSIFNRKDDWYSHNPASGISANITQIKFKRTGGDGVSVRNAKIPLAKHILLNDGTTYGTANLVPTIPDTKVEAISAAISVNFRSFLSNGNITVSLTSGDADVFRLGTSSNTTGTITSSVGSKSYSVGSNACASGNGSSNATASGSTLGDVTKYGFNVYFRPKAATTYSGTITITDGTNTATVTLSGKGVLNDNTISWDVDGATKKNWGQTVSMNATATNTNYSGDANSRPITYSAESGKESYVTIADGKITFNQAGAGQTVTITVNQAANYKYKAASLPKTFIIKSTQVLAYNNTDVIVSVSADDKFTINLDDSRTSHTGDGAITYSVKSGSGAVLSGNTFYSTVANTCVITATAANTANYETCSTDFSVTVNKRTPTFVWQTFDHIYSGAVLTNLAQAQYKGVNVGGLSYSYSSNNTTAAVPVENNTKISVPTTGFTTNQDARISVTTAETDFYLAGSSYHDYLIEPKKSPVFKLNGNVIADGATATIDLLIGQTATVSFENIDNTEATFTKPNNPSFVTYAHNSSTHTGVITATAFGTTNLTFSQAGNDTIFGHTGYVTVNVKKHPVALATTLNGITCEVEDSVASEGAYSIVTSPVDGHPFADVTIVSDNEEVVRFVDGKWRAKKDGNATLSIRMPANAYWTGDTITAAITVNKKTPAITWHLNDNYLWGARINDVVSSTNEDIEYSVTSNNPTVADYVNGAIEVYNKSGDVTFTLSQEGNYKWNAASSNLTKTIHVSQPDNHVEYRVNNGKGVELKKDQTAVYAFTGVAKSVKFTPSSDASRDRNYNLYWSATGADNSYSLFASYTQDQEDVEHEDEIPASAKYLKVEFDGSDWMLGSTTGTFGGLTITARTGIEAPASVAYGMRYMGNNPTVRDIDVDWYSVQPCTITLQGANADRFQIKEGDNTISDAALDRFGSKTIEVSYKHDVEGSHTATLHIESADGKSANVTLTGSTEKAVQQIIWSDEVSPVNRNILIPDAATATSQLDVVLTAEDATVVSVSNGNEITGLKEGTTRVFAYQAGDTKWASIRDTIEVIVTDKKVQHIVWNDRLLNVKRENNQTKTVTLTAYSDADNTLPITYTLDEAARAFASVSGNTLSVTGWGRGTITATQAGNAEYVGLSKTMKIIARNPDAGCNPLVLDDADERVLHTIDNEVYVINGEPRTLSFTARRQTAAIHGLWIYEYYDKDWHEIRSDMGLDTDFKNFGPISLNRKTTKVKFAANFGSTLTRRIKNVQVTQAKYLELDENATDFSRMEVGQVEMQQISVNYSNLTGTLDVELKNPSTQFTVMTQTLGENCGETVQGALVSVRCIGKTEGTENNAIVLSNKDQRLEIPISATVSKLSQTISWNVASTVSVNTTDEVALAATATSELPVSFSSSDNATAEAYQKGDGTWALRIYQAGTITVTASQAGNDNYGATETTRTYIISRVTPEITVLPTAATVSLPATLAGVDLTGGEASVAGTFTWQNSATSVDRFNSGYTVVFTPENTNWYNTATCNVVVPVNKDAQTITWSFSATEVYCDADITFDASASSRLAVRYTSSNASIAYVDEDNKLKIVCGGEVTITAHQDGNETFLAATPVAKMLTIKKFTPEVTAPTAAAIKKGKLLDNATLSGGAATSNGNEVEGIFTWENGSEAMNTAGTFSRAVVFTPSNTNYYNVVRMDVDVEVQKFSPAIEHTLTASAITYGAALSTSELSGTLTATDTVKVPSVAVKGTYAWLNGEAILDAGNPTSATVRFTPTEIDQYNVVDFEVSIIVNQAAPVLSVTASDIASYQTLSQSVLTNDGTPGVCTWDAALDATTAKYTAGDHVLAYTFTPNSANYLSASGTATVHVEKGCVLTNNAEGGWNLASNWENNEQPDENTHVLVQTNIEISHEIAAKSLDIDEGATVTIAPTGGLTIGDGGITNATKENLILKAKLEDDGDGDRGQTAYIRFSPDYEGEMPEATIELFSVGYKDVLGDSGDDYWQYVGVPVAVEGYAAKTAFPKSMVESWHEDQGKWVNDRKNLILKPFVGYATSQYRNAEGFKMTFNGPLVQNRGTVEIDLDYTSGAEHNLKGWNMVANSFAAPIDITRLTVEDFNGADATIYLWDAREDSYIEIPVATLGSLPSSVQRVIPSMQAFFVHTDAATTLTLDYERLVWEGTQDNKPLKVQQKDVNESLTGRMSITMIDAFGKDELYLLESDSYDKSYENGYDAPKKAVEGRSAIYAIEDRELAVDATDDMRGTKIGIRAGEIDTCQLVFSHVESDHVLYFVDNLTGDKYLIEEGTAISLEFIDMEVEGRFEIVGSQDDHGVSTGVESAKSDKTVTKYIKDNTVYILKNGLKYNSLGQRVQ